MLIKANDLCQQLFNFIVVGIDMSDLRKFVQTPQHLLDQFQNRAFMSMMNSKSVKNWITYLRKIGSKTYENIQNKIVLCLVQ